MIYCDTEIRVIKQTSHCGIIGERRRLFMLSKRAELINGWHKLSSPFNIVFHHAVKEEIAHRKLQKTRRAYIKERIKQQEHFNSEIACLDKLLDESSIDEDIHVRLKKLLEIGYERKRRETREKHGFTKDLDDNSSGSIKI